MTSPCLLQKFRKVTHLIFDLDGLLLDSEELFMKGTKRLLKEFGKKYSWDAKWKMMGATGKEIAKMSVKLYELPISWEEYLKRIRPIYNELLPNASVLPGVKNLIKHLHEHKIPCAVATSSSDWSFKTKTQCHQELFSVFHHAVCGGTDPEVKNGKPAPDIFLLAADRFEDKPKYEDCLVFEDAPNGVQAALAAGMQVVMVPDQRLDEDLRKNATLVLKSLEEFQPELFGLPAFSNKCVNTYLNYICFYKSIMIIANKLH